jgi:hypothetical protein
MAGESSTSSNWKRGERREFENGIDTKWTLPLLFLNGIGTEYKVNTGQVPFLLIFVDESMSFCRPWIYRS